MCSVLQHNARQHIHEHYPVRMVNEASHSVKYHLSIEHLSKVPKKGAYRSY